MFEITMEDIQRISREKTGPELVKEINLDGSGIQAIFNALVKKGNNISDIVEFFLIMGFYLGRESIQKENIQ